MTNEHMTLMQIEEFLKESTNLKYFIISDLMLSMEKLIEDSYREGYYIDDDE